MSDDTAARLTGGDVEEQEAAQLVALVKRYNITAPEFVVDLYSIFKYGGKNVLSESTVVRKAQELFAQGGKKGSFWAIKSQLMSKKLFLEDFTQCEWFSLLCRLPPVEAVGMMLEIMHQSAQMYKQAVAQMGVNPQQAMNAGDDGGSGGYQPPMDPDVGGFSDILEWGMMLFDLFSNPALMGGKVGLSNWKSVYHDAHYSPQALLKRVLDEAKRLSQSNLVIFELARNLEKKIDAVGRTERKVDASVPQLREVGQGGVESIFQALPSQKLDDDLLDRKAVARELLVSKNQEVEEKKSLLHVLLDVSGSMGEMAFAQVKKSEAVSALVLALADKVEKRGDIFYLRFFAGGCSPLWKCETPQEVSDISDKVRFCHFDGGSTDIAGALRQAIADIQQAQGDTERLQKAEILLLTDGDDQIDAAALNQERGSIKIHTVIIGDSQGTHHDAFKRLSETYCNTTMQKGMLELVKLGKVL